MLLPGEAAFCRWMMLENRASLLEPSVRMRDIEFGSGGGGPSLWEPLEAGREASHQGEGNPGFSSYKVTFLSKDLIPSWLCLHALSSTADQEGSSAFAQTLPPQSGVPWVGHFGWCSFSITKCQRADSVMGWVPLGEGSIECVSLCVQPSVCTC